MTAKNRIYYLDLVRLLACVMVIVMHAPMPGMGTSGMLLSTVSFLTAPCIGLFFMVSGALLLPVQVTSWQFLKRRLGKVVWPTLIWTFVYMFVCIIEGRIRIDELPHTILSIPFSSQAYGVTWFMYVLCGLYLMAVVVSPWLKQASCRDVELLLALWGCTLCWPMLKLFLTVQEGNNSMLYYFAGYGGYFILLRFMSYIHSAWLVSPWESAKAWLGCKVTKTYPLVSRSLGQRATEGTASCIHDLTEAY